MAQHKPLVIVSCGLSFTYIIPLSFDHKRKKKKGTNHYIHHTNHNNQASYCTTFPRWFCLHEACSMSEGAETTGRAPVQTVTYTRARTLRGEG